jgi:hypothetical protein
MKYHTNASRRPPTAVEIRCFLVPGKMLGINARTQQAKFAIVFPKQMPTRRLLYSGPRKSSLTSDAAIQSKLIVATVRGTRLAIFLARWLDIELRQATANGTAGER